MKCVVILPDGAADEPLAELGGRTPLEAASLPNMHWVARHGRLGRAVTVPAGFTPGTDVATLSVFGYDPHESYSGRAPIEAAARGLSAGPDELIFRCNFVTIDKGRMADYTAGHIAQDEANQLIADLGALAASGEPALRGCRFFTSVSYRNLMIADGATAFDLRTAPPHDIPDRPVADHLPQGAGRERVLRIMTAARAMLADHEVNRRRRAEKRSEVTDIWLWGQGQPVALTPFEERFGLSGVVITGVDIIRGLALMMGMELLEVPGATGYIDTNYAGKGAAAVRALEQYDLVVAHIEAPDEAGHLGNVAEKVTALEQIDEHVVGPLLRKLQTLADWRMLIAPDHPTPCTTMAHDATPPPFCFAGSGVPATEGGIFTEAEALASGLVVDPGHRLMELVLAG
ncbi:MAG: cofactor-independent phosphoglycerate mutase [Phycisphaerae bacterium]|jgi:2,3-bisphosphoglycerate-independent phosphoglycerate mutase